MSNRLLRVAPRVGRPLVLAAVCLSLTGCGFVKAVAMIPIDIAKTVAVETAKVPFKAAELGVSATVDAVAGGVDALLAGK